MSINSPQASAEPTTEVLREEAEERAESWRHQAKELAASSWIFV